MIKRLGNRLKNDKGMTLIELLAVIVILGIIAAIAIPSIGGIIQNSREDAVKADAITILNAGKLYVASHGNDINGSLTMGSAELNEYLESNTSFGNNYAVVYSGSTYAITSAPVTAGAIGTIVGITAGKNTIKFNGAEITNINADTPDPETGVITIDDITGE